MLTVQGLIALGCSVSQGCLPHTGTTNTIKKYQQDTPEMLINTQHLLKQTYPAWDNI